MNASEKQWLSDQMAKVAQTLYPPPPTKAEVREREAQFAAVANHFKNPDPHWWARRSYY